MDLNGKTCLMTGCASGIGKHLLGVFVRLGAKVLATDVNLDALRDAVAAHGWPEDWVRIRLLDVRDAAQWRAAVDEAVQTWGKLDYAVNVAGIVLAHEFCKAPYEAMDLQIDVNLKGVMFGCRAAAEVMVPQRSGHIINIASMASLAPIPGLSLYNASKFGVRGFSHAIAMELSDHNVQVTTVCPDAVATPMLDDEAVTEAAMMAFSGFTILTVEDIERAFMTKVLPKRPREVIVSSPLGILARLVTAYPAVSGWLMPSFREKARRKQAEYRASLGKRK